MPPKQRQSADTETAVSVLNCLGKQWEMERFCDLTVVVNKKIFQCHRFILSACSDFFDGLLRSDMRENRTGEVHVKGVSAETFALLLDAVYKGQKIHTVGNMIEIWHAANQLQIPFLIKASEDFVVKKMSLQNAVKVYQHGKLLDSQPVLNKFRQMMMQNFSTVCKSNDFLDLSGEDFLAILNLDKNAAARKLRKKEKETQRMQQLGYGSYEPMLHSASNPNEDAGIADTKVLAILRWVTSGRYQAPVPESNNFNPRFDSGPWGHQISGPYVHPCMHDFDSRCNGDSDEESPLSDAEETEFAQTRLRVPNRGDDFFGKVRNASGTPEVAEKQKYLGELLRTIDLSEVSDSCLSELLRHELVLSHPKAVSMVNAAAAKRLTSPQSRGRSQDFRVDLGAQIQQDRFFQPFGVVFNNFG